MTAASGDFDATLEVAGTYTLLVEGQVGAGTSPSSYRFVVEPKGAQWTCYYSERGGRYDEKLHDSREGAARDAVMRLLGTAWTLLNVRYWHKHHPSVERMPAFGAPWPA